MAALGWMRAICLAAMGMAAWATAQTIEPANTTADNTGHHILLTISMGDNMVPLAPVIALTPGAIRSIPPTGLSGTMFLANATSTLYVDAHDIALINCDPVPGELQADYMLNQVVRANASAVLFYSPTSDTCILQDYQSPYGWVYSMRQNSDTQRLLVAIETSFESEQELWGQIAYADTLQGTGNGSEGFGGRDLGSHAGEGNDDDQSPLGPSPTTAVAMIILYSITGIITALFLVIIVTGALRAHRHPERYGPRNIVGRPRQSRAKGIARAMLDTLPIVKFGQRDEEPKPTDIELGEQGSENRRQSADGQTTTSSGANETSSQQKDTTSRSADNDAAPRRHSTASDGIAAAVTGARRDSNTPNPDHLGCSICTEDFESGQDQRVLPCDHRFHPDCVDPWLLNVSGTCPLCRIDLHPPAEEGDLDEEGNPVQRETDANGDPLPLDGQGTAAQPQRLGVRRSLLIGLIGARSVERMSREERLATLRQLRARQQQRREREGHADATPAAPEAEGERAEQASSEDSSRIRNRLRRVLGVRTRSTEDTSREGEQR